MFIRLLIQIALIVVVVACTTPATRTTVMTYDSIELSQGVVRLINNAEGQPIALENDARIRCVDMTPPGDESPSRYCQTRDEFNSNLEHGHEFIRSIDSNTQP